MHEHPIVRRHGLELVGLPRVVPHEVDQLPLQVQQDASILLVLVQSGDYEAVEVYSGRVSVVGGGGV